MDFKDKNLKCRDCGQDFLWKSGEQEFFSVKGFPPPSRCTDCRKKRKEQRTSGVVAPTQSFGDHKITCTLCGKIGEVPFEPRNPEGVLCAECFEKKPKEKN